MPALSGVGKLGYPPVIGEISATFKGVGWGLIIRISILILSFFIIIDLTFSTTVMHLLYQLLYLNRRVKSSTVFHSTGNALTAIPF